MPFRVEGWDEGGNSTASAHCLRPPHPNLLPEAEGTLQQGPQVRHRCTSFAERFVGWAVILSLLLSATVTAAATHPSDEALFSVSREIHHDGFKDRFDAQVWLKDMSRRLADKVPDMRRRFRLLELVHREASRLAIPPELVLAVIDVESDFHRFAISKAGAQGYMQVMPFWREKIGRPMANLFDPKVNIRIGCMVLRHYLNEAQGDMMHALAAYNGSTGSTRYSDKVLRALTRRWFRQ